MTVIFPDQNISPKHFADAPEGHLFVRTIFFTIQGEGPFVGRPAVFVRLGGCNLGAKGVGAAGCSWCDTDFRIEKSQWMTFHEIEMEACRLVAHKVKKFDGAIMRYHPLYVITGGEPMLQAKSLGEFIQWTGWDVQIETNGMYYAPLPFKTEIVVSPKLGGAKEYPPLNKSWQENADCLKFVLEADPESPYHIVPEYAFAYALMGVTVYVSPIAVYRRPMSPEEGERASIWNRDLIDAEATARNYQYAAEYAMENGLRLSMQTHLFASMP